MQAAHIRPSESERIIPPTDKEKRYISTTFQALPMLSDFEVTSFHIPQQLQVTCVNYVE